MTSIHKKLVGTSIYVSIIAVLALGFVVQARAQYVQRNTSLHVDGTVVAVTPTSFTVDTSGTNGVELMVNQRSKFVGLSFAGLQVGDKVSVVAQHSAGSNATARLVRYQPQVGYGFVSDNVVVRSGNVIAKGADWLTVDTGLVHATFDVVAATNFYKTTFAALSVGDNVTVTGYDSGSGFVANTVAK